MNTKLQAKYLTMAAATLGLTLGAGCAKKSEGGEAAESGEAASGAESSCGAGSCGSHEHGDPASVNAEGKPAAENGPNSDGAADNDATEQVGAPQ